MEGGGATWEPPWSSGDAARGSGKAEDEAAGKAAMCGGCAQMEGPQQGQWASAGVLPNRAFRFVEARAAAMSHATALGAGDWAALALAALAAAALAASETANAADDAARVVAAGALAQAQAPPGTGAEAAFSLGRRSTAVAWAGLLRAHVLAPALAAAPGRALLVVGGGVPTALAAVAASAVVCLAPFAAWAATGGRFQKGAANSGAVTAPAPGLTAVAALTAGALAGPCCAALAAGPIGGSLALALSIAAPFGAAVVASEVARRGRDLSWGICHFAGRLVFGAVSFAAALCIWVPKPADVLRFF